MSRGRFASVLFAAAALGLDLYACGRTASRPETIAARPPAPAAALAGEPKRPAAGERRREEQVGVEQLTKIVARGEVRAPFAGTVGVRYLDPGAMVSASTPIVRIIGARDRVVRFAIPERDRPGLAPGQPVAIVLGG